MAPDDHGQVAALTQAANELVEQIQHLRTDSGQQMVTLAKRSTRTRAMVYALAISLAFDLIITIVLVRVAIRANEAGVQAEQVRAQQMVTCQSSNEARQLNRQLWDYLFALPPTSPRTKAQDKQIADFKAFIGRVYAPRDCSKI